MKIEQLVSSEWDRLRRIRLAALRDAPYAFSTTFDAAQEWSDDVWRQQVENLPTFVATTDAQDVGMARGQTSESNTDALLISMWVLPTARGKHVGEQLVEAVASWARDAGFTRLVLNVADDNAAAIALYQRLNFQPTGETSAYPPPRAHVTEHCRARML